jgi:hypothetical protein
MELLSLRMVATAALLLSATPALCAGQTGGAQAGMEWTGTISVDRSANGTLRGGETSLGFNARQTVTFTLNGDGTGTWVSSFTSSTDMGGFYTIPSNGSGSGFATGSVGFNGQYWEIYVAPEDDLTVYTNYTAQDRVWADKGAARILYEIAKAMGEPAPRPGTHIEKGGVGVPGAQVPSRQGANATSLSGSVSETVPGGADQMGGPGTIPATYTYSWNLTKGPARSHVKIYGPECGCLDADATEKTLHFIAGASPAGGEFSEFVVTSNGEAPRIDSNTGGDRPSLDITGTKGTGTVTLKIRYQRNGSTAESAPFTVDFCAIEKIQLEDGDAHDIGFDLDGKLIVEAKTKAWRGGKEVSSELEWDIEKMGSPTSLNAFRREEADGEDIGQVRVSAGRDRPDVLSRRRQQSPR